MMNTRLGIDAIELANCHIQTYDKKRGTLESIQTIQSGHRLRITEEWLLLPQNEHNKTLEKDVNLSLFKGNILDVGCGQGDQTGAIGACLAKYSPSSHVYGLDPGPADYGSPYTLAQAQQYISESELGKFITFEKAGKTQETLARYPQGYFTSLTFSHCLWYFEDERMIIDAFSSALKNGVENILIAEWSLSSSKFALSHILAALLQAHAPLSNINIKLLLSSDRIIQIASQAGWKVVRQSVFTPDEKLQDGRWEVEMAIDSAKEWLKRVSSENIGKETDNKELISIQSHLHALCQSLPIDKNQIRCMDVWTCHLIPLTE